MTSKLFYRFIFTKIQWTVYAYDSKIFYKKKEKTTSISTAVNEENWKYFITLCLYHFVKAFKAFVIKYLWTICVYWLKNAFIWVCEWSDNHKTWCDEILLPTHRSSWIFLKLKQLRVSLFVYYNNIIYSYILYTNSDYSYAYHIKIFFLLTT